MRHSGPGQRRPALGEQRVDFALAVATLALGLFMIAVAAGFREGTVPDPVGAGGFVIGAAVLLVGAGGILVVRHLRAWNAGLDVVGTEGRRDDPGHPASAARAMVVAAVTSAFVILVEPLGFVLAAPAFMGGVLFLMGVRGARLVLVAVLAVAVVHLLFVGLFGILLPLGPLHPLSDLLWFRF